MVGAEFKSALLKSRLMKTSGCLLLLLLIFLMPFPGAAQKNEEPVTGSPARSSKTPSSTRINDDRSAARGAASAGAQVAPDLAQRLEKFKRVQMPFHSAGLTSREKKMVEKLVDASRYLEDIYWRQSDPEGLTLYQTLARSKNAKDQQLRHYLWINGSRFDQIDKTGHLSASRPCHRGGAFIPKGLTRKQIEQYVQDHPEKKAEIYSSTTIVRWHRDQLEGLAVSHRLPIVSGAGRPGLA